MYEGSLDITFISDWHIGSGLGDGAIADAVLTRDVNGLLRVPGSAVKGALREGAWRLAIASPNELKGLVDFFFGTATADQEENSSGCLDIGDGVLEPTLRQWLLQQNPPQRREFVRDLTWLRQQTALDSARMVVPHSLRTIECGVPGVRFHTTIVAHIPSEVDQWFAGYLTAICACVKSIGADRARGLGQCRFTLKDGPGIAMPLPVPPQLRSVGKGGESR